MTKEIIVFSVDGNKPKQLKTHLTEACTQQNAKLIIGSDQQSLYLTLAQHATDSDQSYFQQLAAMGSCKLKVKIETLTDLDKNLHSHSSLSVSEQALKFLNELEINKKNRPKALAQKLNKLRTIPGEILALQPSKIPLLYIQIHKVAKEDTQRTIDFRFYSSDEPILQSAYAFFDKYPFLLPQNVTLTLYRYNNTNKSLVTLPEQFNDTILGTGIIDKNYKAILNLAIHQIVSPSGYIVYSPKLTPETTCEQTLIQMTNCLEHPQSSRACTLGFPTETINLPTVTKDINTYQLIAKKTQDPIQKVVVQYFLEWALFNESPPGFVINFLMTYQPSEQRLTQINGLIEQSKGQHVDSKIRYLQALYTQLCEQDQSWNGTLVHLIGSLLMNIRHRIEVLEKKPLHRYGRRAA